MFGFAVPRWREGRPRDWFVGDDLPARRRKAGDRREHHHNSDLLHLTHSPVWLRTSDVAGTSLVPGASDSLAMLLRGASWSLLGEAGKRRVRHSRNMCSALVRRPGFEAIPRTVTPSRGHLASECAASGGGMAAYSTLLGTLRHALRPISRPTSAIVLRDSAMRRRVSRRSTSARFVLRPWVGDRPEPFPPCIRQRCPPRTGKARHVRPARSPRVFAPHRMGFLHSVIAPPPPRRPD